MIEDNASPGDIYLDARGKLWRVKYICREPTVTMEEVEGYIVDPSSEQHYFAGANAFTPPRARIEKSERQNPLSSTTWNDFICIWSGNKKSSG